MTPESAPLTKTAMTSFFDYVIKNGVKVKALKGVSNPVVCLTILVLIRSTVMGLDHQSLWGS